jgi:hypothetical protein
MRLTSLCQLPSWVLFVIFILSLRLAITGMVTVSCGASRCSWEKDTDFRGLSRHRSTCKHYQKARTLASQKRRDWTNESIKTSQKLTATTTTTGSSSTTPVRLTESESRFSPWVGLNSYNLQLTHYHDNPQLRPILSTQTNRLKPIARCGSRTFCTLPQAEPSTVNPKVGYSATTSSGCLNFCILGIGHFRYRNVNGGRLRYHRSDWTWSG